jgi:hypothetical protein
MYIEKYYVKMRVNFGIPVNAQSFIPVFFMFYPFIIIRFFLLLYIGIHKLYTTSCIAVKFLHLFVSTKSAFPWCSSFKTKVEKPPSYKFEDQRLYFILSVKRLDRILLIF